MLDTPLLVSRILEHGAERHGNTTITGFGDRFHPRTVRFDVIASRAAATAHALSELGIGIGDVVGILSEIRTESVEAVFALPSMGAVALPINILRSPSFIISALEANRVSVILVDPEVLSPSLRWRPVSRLRHVVVLDSQVPRTSATPACARARGHARRTVHHLPLAGAGTNSAAAIAYTPAPRAIPRGWLHPPVDLAHSHADVHVARRCAVGQRAHHGADAPRHVLGAALQRSCPVPVSSLRPRPGAVPHRSRAELLATHRPNKVSDHPDTLQRLLRRLESHPQSLAHLSEVVVGGSPVPEALFDAFVKRHGVTLIQAYGLTETSPIAAFARPDPHSSATHRRAQALGQGRFPAAVQARIVDAGRIQPNDGWQWASQRGPGSPPVICTTRSRALVDGWLRTGDMASITPRGYLDVVDRVDDITPGGERSPAWNFDTPSSGTTGLPTPCRDRRPG